MTDNQSMVFFIGKNDTLPMLPIQCTFEDIDGVEKPFDLTGWTLKFYMRREGASGAPKVDGLNAVIDNAPLGIAHYPWAVGDTDTSGVYAGDFVATQGAQRITFPNKVPKIRVIVGEDAA